MPMPLRSRSLLALLCRIAALAFPVVLLVQALFPAPSQADEGFATWYGQPFHGRTMANGQRYDMNDPTTTASNMYPFGTWLRVTNPANGNSVTVQVRDRGAFTHALDLSHAAFAALDDPNKMRIRVIYEVVSSPLHSAPAQPAPTMAAPRAPALAPAAAPAPARSQTFGEYVVKAGDTLVGIAQRFAMPLAELMQINGIKNADRLSPGSRLQLSAAAAEQRSTPPEGTSTRSADSTPSEDAGARSAGHAPAVAATEHTVAAGETLWQIAVKYKMTPAELVQVNDLGNPNLLSAGQRLRLSGAREAAPSPPAPSREAAAPAPSAEAAVPAPRAEAAAASGAPVTDHAVRDGETLSDIAVKYKLTPAELVALNGIQNPDHLAVGQQLRVARSSPPAAAAPPAQPSEHVVAAGETLWDIAVRYSLTPAELVQLNDLNSPDLLPVGQRLRVARGSAPVAAVPGPTATEHAVVAGDTLLDIAARYKLTAAELMELNNIDNPDQLAVGRRLRVARTAAVAAPASAAQAIAARSSRPYVVQPGDSLSSIAARFDTTVQHLMNLNGLSNADLLQPDQVLRLP